MLTAILTATLALSAGEIELLQFTSPHCPACQTMTPIMKRVAESGVVVKPIDVESREDLARQFAIKSLPTTIAVRDGRIIDRIEGVASFDRLMTAVTERPSPERGPAARPSLRQAETFLASSSALPRTNSNSALNLPRETAANPANPQHLAYAATVRLKVLDAQGHGVGTGTIIDRHGEEALVITCAHIFRTSQGKGEIQVELFAKPGPTVKGQLIDWDLHRDVALIALRPGFEVPVVTVAGADYQSQVGEPVFTIGCNKGQDPTVESSRIATVNKYHGRPNVTVKGQPIDGRSGGGLFSADGKLIGICNAADAIDDEGLYASLPAVHWQLDKIGQKRIYARQTPVVAATFTSSGPSEVPALPAKMPLPLAAKTESETADDLEVICVVRRKSQPHLPPQTFPLSRIPAEVAARLSASEQPAAGRAPERLSAAPTPSGLIIRGQQ